MTPAVIPSSDACAPSAIAEPLFQLDLHCLNPAEEGELLKFLPPKRAIDAVCACAARHAGAAPTSPRMQRPRPAPPLRVRGRQGFGRVQAAVVHRASATA